MPMTNRTKKYTTRSWLPHLNPPIESYAPWRISHSRIYHSRQPNADVVVQPVRLDRWYKCINSAMVSQYVAVYLHMCERLSSILWNFCFIYKCVWVLTLVFIMRSDGMQYMVKYYSSTHLNYKPPLYRPNYTKVVFPRKSEVLLRKNFHKYMSNVLKLYFVW